MPNKGRRRRQEKALRESMRRHEVNSDKPSKYPKVIGAAPGEGKEKRQVSGLQEQAIRVKARQKDGKA